MDFASPWWTFRDDPRNARIYELNLERTLDDVLAESRQTVTRLFAAVETLSEDDLHDPARFKGMPEDWVPWKLIAMNTCDHYTHHMIDLRRWLA
jgi:hypothetical protein